MHLPQWMWALAWLSLALPTLWDFLGGAWVSYSQGHEVLLLSVAGWLFTKKISKAINVERAVEVLPSLLLVLGLLVYFVGRTQEYIRLELLGLWWTTQMMVCVIWGARIWRESWFIWLFLLFAMPLPFSWVLALTAPLKIAVSLVAAAILHLFEYPIARTGVVLTIGQYQLLVAEACAGLQSMFVLEAMGMLYSYLANHGSRWRTAILLISVVPISFLANVFRVVILALVTYYFGDAVGQGFVHRFAGLVLFATAFMLMAAWDLVLGWQWPDKASNLGLNEGRQHA